MPTYREICLWQPWDISIDCWLWPEKSHTVHLGTYYRVLPCQFSTYNQIAGMTQPVYLLQVVFVRINFNVKVCLQVDNISIHQSIHPSINPSINQTINQSINQNDLSNGAIFKEQRLQVTYTYMIFKKKQVLRWRLTVIENLLMIPSRLAVHSTIKINTAQKFLLQSAIPHFFVTGVLEKFVKNKEGVDRNRPKSVLFLTAGVHIICIMQWKPASWSPGENFFREHQIFG